MLEKSASQWFNRRGRAKPRQPISSQAHKPRIRAEYSQVKVPNQRLQSIVRGWLVIWAYKSTARIEIAGHPKKMTKYHRAGTRQSRKRRNRSLRPGFPRVTAMMRIADNA